MRTLRPEPGAWELCSGPADSEELGLWRPRILHEAVSSCEQGIWAAVTTVYRVTGQTPGHASPGSEAMECFTVNLKLQVRGTNSPRQPPSPSHPPPPQGQCQDPPLGWVVSLYPTLDTECGPQDLPTPHGASPHGQPGALCAV